MSYVQVLLISCKKLSKLDIGSYLLLDGEKLFFGVILVMDHPQKDLSLMGDKLLENSQNSRESGRKT
jgi:hypothetical protein